MPSSDTSPINRFRNDFPRQFIQLEQITSGPYSYGQIYQHKISHELVLERLNQNRQPDQKEFSRILNTLSADVISQIQLQDNIYYEYIPHTLFEEIRIRSQDRVPFQEADIWYVTFKLATILTHIKSRAIYHMDLRPYNILIEQNGNIKLAPMGTFSDDINCVEKQLSHGIATNVPFDVLNNQQNIQWDQVDIFGLGITLMNMISCQNRQFESREEIVQFFNVYQKYYSSNLIDFIRGLVIFADKAPKIEDIYNKLLPYKQQINTFQSFGFNSNYVSSSPQAQRQTNQQSYNSPGQGNQFSSNTIQQSNQAINLQPVTSERIEGYNQKFENQSQYNQQVDKRYQTPQSQQTYQTQSIQNQIQGNINTNTQYVSSRIVENQQLNQVVVQQSPIKNQQSPNQCSNCHKELSYQEILSYSQQKQQWSRLSQEQQQFNSASPIKQQQQQQITSEVQNINTLVKNNQKIEIQEQRQFGIFDEYDQRIWHLQQIQVPQQQIIDIKYRQLQNQNQIVQNYSQNQDQYYNQSRYQQVSQNVNNFEQNGQQYQQQQNQGNQLELTFQNSQIQQGLTQNTNQSQNQQNYSQTQGQYNQQYNQGYQQEGQFSNKQTSQEAYSNSQNQNTEQNYQNYQQNSQNYQQNSQHIFNQGIQGVQNQEIKTQISQNRTITPLTYNQPLLETIRNSRHNQQPSFDSGNQFQQSNQQQASINYQQDQQQSSGAQLVAQNQQNNSSNQQFNQQSIEVQRNQTNIQQNQQELLNQNTQIQQLPVYPQELPQLQQASVQNLPANQSQVAPIRPQVLLQTPPIQPVSQQIAQQAVPQQQISNNTYNQQQNTIPLHNNQFQQLPIHPQELPQLQQAPVQNMSEYQQVAPFRPQVFIQPPIQQATQQTQLINAQSFTTVQGQSAQSIQSLKYSQQAPIQQQIIHTNQVQQLPIYTQELPQFSQPTVQNTAVAPLRPQVLMQPPVIQAANQQTQLTHGLQNIQTMQYQIPQDIQQQVYNSTYTQQAYSIPQQIIQPQPLVYQNPTLVPQVQQLHQSALPYNRPQQLRASQQLPQQQQPVLFQSSQVSLPNIQQTNPINVPSSIITNAQK